MTSTILGRTWLIPWAHLVDYETLWVLAFSAAVIGSGIFGLLSIAQNNPQLLP
jgi:hypothetical protein